MSENNFNSDLDAILAEFASYSGGPTEEKTPAARPERAAQSAPFVPDDYDEEAPETESVAGDGYYVDVDVSMLTELLENHQSSRAQAKRPMPSQEPPRPKAAPAKQREERETAARRDEAGRPAAKMPERPHRVDRQEAFSPSFKPSGRE